MVKSNRTFTGCTYFLQRERDRVNQVDCNYIPQVDSYLFLRSSFVGLRVNVHSRRIKGGVGLRYGRLYCDPRHPFLIFDGCDLWLISSCRCTITMPLPDSTATAVYRSCGGLWLSLPFSSPEANIFFFLLLRLCCILLSRRRLFERRSLSWLSSRRSFRLQTRPQQALGLGLVVQPLLAKQSSNKRKKIAQESWEKDLDTSSGPKKALSWRAC